ncbi:MAG: CPBP family intramembrane metalloprotease, partial [Lachnospiraceae bacterium]|nr:CPBP family intramembrane metalloprotease [Lachnospiraceae bacterium]
GGAMFASAIVFGAFHGNMAQFIYASILGFFLAWFMEYFHSIKAPILLHMSANCWGFILSFYGGELTKLAGGVPVLLILAAQIAILVLSLIYILQKRSHDKKYLQ